MAPPTTRPDTLPGVERTRAALDRLRPELTAAFEAAVPGARAAVLSRLLGALRREPLPGLDAAVPAAALSPATEPHSAPGTPTSPTTAPHGAPGTPTSPTTEPAVAEPPSPAAESLGPVPASARAAPTSRTAAPPAWRARLADGRSVTFAHAASQPFADAEPGLVAVVDGQPCDDPATLARTLWPDATLAAELDNSVANLALGRAATPTGPDPWAATATLRGAAGDPDGLGRLEQLVVDGHPLHPGCRTRGGLTTADVLAYAPEHRPVLHLRRLAVPPERWVGDGPPILYAHPWQAARLLDEFGWLSDAGPTGPVRPLMSLRTVAPVGGGDHVKTAVDVQMTSAVRTVSPAAVHNGPVLSALLATLTAGLPLTVPAETAGAVLVDGQPQRRLAHLRRQAPRIRADETVVPLAALAAWSPADGRPLLCEAVAAHGGDPYRWLTDLAAVLWPPLLAVLDRGVALEAHGQNTLVVLRGGRPMRIVYRDLGGVRVSPARLRAAGVTPPELRGDLPADDPVVLRTKLAAAAVGTVAAELVALLGRHHGAEPGRLWRIVAAAIRGAGTADAAALLREPLPVKATTAMRLAADPLDDVWTYLDNPMAGDT